MVNAKLESISSTPDIHDVVVIGAGPHSLAVCSRLIEKNPSAIYTDLEHARLSWLNKQRLRVDPKGAKRKLISHPNTLNGLKVRVFDKHPPCTHQQTPWMAHWCTMFQNLDITSMRSPMFFHSNPRDVDALLAYAYATNREKELQDIPGVVGKELSKHAKKKLVKTGKRPSYEDPVNERNRQDFKTPSSKCFFDFCREDIEQYYGIDRVVERGEVTHLGYDYYDEHNAERIFKITKEDGEQVLSKSVVVAIGNNTIPNIPSYLRSKITSKPQEVGLDGMGWCHTSAFARPGYAFPNKALQRPSARLLVVGGGLTSAQVIDKAFKNGVTDITLMVRTFIKTKPFDFDTEWVDKYQNLSKMIFWREECMRARKQMIMDARNGGSVNVPYCRRLKELESKGVLKVMTCTEISSATYDDDEGVWDVTAVSKEQMGKRRRRSSSSVSATSPDHHEQPAMHTHNNLKFDYLVSATGSTTDINRVGFLNDFISANPINSTDGLPHLTDDLQWNADIPLFVMGGLASLVLGPSSFNLGGARDGAERIAIRMNEILDSSGDNAKAEQQEDPRHALMQRLALNNGNYYDILGEDAD